MYVELIVIKIFVHIFCTEILKVPFPPFLRFFFLLLI